ncbi:hypothetical protein D3C86_1833280 [compost metagenome]
MPAFQHLHQAAGHQAMGRTARDILAPIENPPLHHLAPLGPHQIGRGLQRGAFAGTVGPQQHHDLALRHHQGYPAHGEDGLFIKDFNRVDLQDRYWVHAVLSKAAEHPVGAGLPAMDLNALR